MKAIVFTEYGPPDVLQVKEVATPTPKDNEVLIRIRATPVNFGDITARNFKAVTPRNFTMPLPLWLPARLQMGWSKPKRSILGSEFAGDIEAVGKAVTRFKEGDPVFGYRAMNFGAYAELLCMPSDGLVAIKPDNISYEEAAAVPYGALTAMNLLKRANIQAGQKVLINGASGGIGAGAVQLAKHYGAEVTGVCGTNRVEMVKALGAEHVIDYTQEDFTRNGESYDLIMDILNKSSFSRCKDSLTPKGRYLLASFKTGQLIQMLWTSFGRGKKVTCALSMESLDDLLQVQALVAAGKIKAVIDQSFPMAQAAEAHRYVESGQKTGSVIITMAGDG